MNEGWVCVSVGVMKGDSSWYQIVPDTARPDEVLLSLPVPNGFFRIVPPEEKGSPASCQLSLRTFHASENITNPFSNAIKIKIKAETDSFLKKKQDAHQES